MGKHSISEGYVSLVIKQNVIRDRPLFLPLLKQAVLSKALIALAPGSNITESEPTTYQRRADKPTTAAYLP